MDWTKLTGGQSAAVVGRALLMTLALAGACCFGCAQPADSAQGSVSTATSTNQQLSSDAVSWREASEHVGETVSIYGPVVSINHESTDERQRTYVDLGLPYPDTKRLTMIVEDADKGAFPDEIDALYADKTLNITGEIYQYEGSNYIAVTSPSQVQVLG